MKVEEIIEYLENHTSPGTTIAEKLGLLREEYDEMHNLLTEFAEYIVNVYEATELVSGVVIPKCEEWQKAKQYLHEHK